MVGRREQTVVSQFLRCRIHEDIYCIDMSWIRGIRRMDQVVPHTGEGSIVGWLAYEERQTPVYRFSTLLHREANVSESLGKILLFKQQTTPWALLVDQVEGVLEVASEEVVPLPYTARNPAADFFLGVINQQDRMLLIVSPEGIQPQGAPPIHRSVTLAYTLEMLYRAADIRAARIGDIGKLFLFATSSEQQIRFGLSLSQVAQVLEPLPIMPIPCAQPYLLGVAQWRGLPLAVIDLSQRMGSGPSVYEQHTRLLVIRAVGSHECVGVPIQPQVDIRTLPIDAHVSNHPQPFRTAFIRGQFALADITLIIPDIDRVVTPDKAPHMYLHEVCQETSIAI